MSSEITTNKINSYLDLALIVFREPFDDSPLVLLDAASGACMVRSHRFVRMMSQPPSFVFERSHYMEIMCFGWWSDSWFG